MRVIIECKSCHTRFRLDDERIPAAGAKVRCSRCKTAFVVQRPGASRDEIVDEVVAEATDPGAARAPTPTEDLFETTGHATMSLSGATEAGDAKTPSDERWEFDEAPAQGAPREKPQRARVAAAVAPAAEAHDLDALGSPEGWDFLGGGARALAADARFESTPAAPPTSHRAKRARPAEPEVGRAVDRAIEAAVVRAPAARAHESRPGWLLAIRSAGQFCIDSGVWMASIMLCSAGLLLALSPRAERKALGTDAFAATYAGSSLDVTVHEVESGVGGMLSVVRGQLPASPAASGPIRLRVSWLDAEGRPIEGASAIAGPPLARGKVRELSLPRLRAESEARARELVPNGPFEVVFGPLPTGARGISLTQERVPIAAPVATQPEEGGGQELGTTSSRPGAHPSSE